MTFINTFFIRKFVHETIISYHDDLWALVIFGPSCFFGFVKQFTGRFELVTWFRVVQLNSQNTRQSPVKQMVQ